MVRWIIGGSLRFRLMLVALAAGIMVLGATQLTKMHADVLPETSPTVVEVQTEAPGLSGQEVEALITVPMEHNLLDGVLGVTDVTSDSVAGLSSIDLHFKPGFDLLHARQLVQERLTQAFALPNVSKPPVMLQPVSSTNRVMMIGLTSGRLSPIELSVLARWTIVPRLLGLPGVANVSTFGQADRQLQVLVDPARLAARHVSLAQIIQTAGNSQLVSPLSFLEASTPGTGGFLEGPNQRITIRHLLPFGTPRDLGQVPVAGVNGPPLALGKVATIVQGHQPLIGNALVRGAPGLVLVVQKAPSASVPAVTRAVDNALAELRPGLASVQIDRSLFRPATYVHRSFHNVTIAAIVGAALAAMALVALLLQLRLAFVALVATALSLVSATLVLDALGYTFNALVVLGLLIGLVIVIDDAVGDAHNLAARMRERRAAGEQQSIATVVTEACSELRGALGYATAIVLLSIVPVFFASGLTARFLHPMVLAFGLAVIASMVVALTVTPALAVLVLPGAGAGSSRGRALAARFAAGYRKALDRAARTPRAALLVVCAIGLGGLAAVPWLSQPDPPSFKDRSLVVQWTGAPGMSLQEMDRITQRASAELRALPGVADVGANIGRALTADQVVNTNSGEIWVTIKPGADYGRTVASVRAIAQGTPGMRGEVSTYERDRMSGELASAGHTLVTRIYGQDFATLGRIAGQVRRVMAGIQGVEDPQVRLPTQQPTLDVQVDLAKARHEGVKPGDVRREAATLLSGLTVGNFFEQQKVFDVVVWGAPSVRSSLTRVQDLLLDTVDGGHVRLGDIARIGVKSEPTDIQHQAISRYVDVSGRVSGRSAGSARAAVQRALRSVAFPLEYRAEVLSGSNDPATSHATFMTYVLAAILGILLIAQAAVGSWSLALVVLVLLPVSLTGGVLVAVAAGDADSLGAIVGLLAVLGIAARQAIGLTARIRRLQSAEEGGRPAEVVARAAGDRAPSIVAATLVAAAALVPFAVIGDVPGNEMLHVAAAVILGGLASSAIVNLLVLPAVCMRLAPPPPVEFLEPADELVLTAPAAEGSPR